MPSGVEARELGSWSGQKLQKMDFQNIERAGMPKVELAERLSLSPQLQAAKSWGGGLCVWVGGVVMGTWLA